MDKKIFMVTEIVLSKKKAKHALFDKKQKQKADSST